jgi:hypothetical protein
MFRLPNKIFYTAGREQHTHPGLMYFTGRSDQLDSIQGLKRSSSYVIDLSLGVADVGTITINLYHIVLDRAVPRWG